MSSFIGHGLTAVAIGKGFSAKFQFEAKWAWLIFLLACVYAPDIDYLVPALDRLHNGGLRITHTILFSLLLPACGIFYLFIFDRKNVFWGGVQACLAGLSHLILDTLVGSRESDPLFYPLTTETFRLPFGILPSAAKVSLSNSYFYRNLLIECGILMPAFLLILYFAGRLNLNKTYLALSIISLLIFLSWSIGLTR
jgi:inner membrane protein